MSALDEFSPRVESCIADVMKRFRGTSESSQARYFAEVHQHLAPLARQLERELAEAKANAKAAWVEVAAAKRAAQQPSGGDGLIPCAYRVGPVAFGAVKIEESGQIEGPPLWAVRKDGNCLNKLGEWEYEPMPSSRDDEFLARCRFVSAGEAFAALAAAISSATVPANTGTSANN